MRPGPLGTPHSGVGRLALETGVPVAPVAVIGTEDVRRGWRIRPRKVRLRVGRPLALPARRALLAEPRRRGHRTDLGVRQPAVGLVGRRAGRARRAAGRAAVARGLAGRLSPATEVGCMGGRAGKPEVQGAARRGVHRAVPGSSPRRLLLRLLPGGQPSRRRGPHRADVPAGLPPLRARAARIEWPAAAAVADPDRAQPGGEPLPRPLAQAGLSDRRDDHDHGPAHDRAAGRGAGRAEPHPRRRRQAARTIAARR